MGVPQGSILGPLLFILFVNDMPECTRHSSMDLYADDTTMKTAHKHLASVEQSLNEDLSSLTAWMAANRLILNLKKTVCMLIGTAQRLASLPSTELTIRVAENSIEQVKSSKLLGVTVDETLSWGDHIDQTCKKISRKIGLVRHLRPVIPHRALMSLYRALVVPLFDYCDVVWGSASDRLITRVARLQNRGARVLTGARRYSRVTPLYRKLNWKTFSERVTFHKAVLVYKSLNGLTPDYLTTLFRQVQHQYRTRHVESAALQCPKPRLECFRRSFRYSGVKIWNSLPSAVKQANSLAQFKTKYLHSS